MLMNSSYDLIYDEDLPGFLCIKTHFWDEGVPNVPVVIRRKTTDGDWVWLSCRAVAYVTTPVPGITLEEMVIEDVPRAQRYNRVTRITAVVVQAVEAAWLTEQTTWTTPAAEKQVEPPPIGSLLNDDVQAYQQLMQSMADSGESVVSDALHNLISIATHNPAASQLEQEIIERYGQQNKTFDPFSMIESVRKGVRLDLGLTRLQREEVKLLTAVLIGIVSVEEAITAVLSLVESADGLEQLASMITLECDYDGTQHQQSTTSISSIFGDSMDNDTLDASRGSLTSSMAPVNPVSPPPIAVLNLSYTYIGDVGIEMLSELLYKGSATLLSLDVSFCEIEERGLKALARGLVKRKRKNLPFLKGVIVSGNRMTVQAATHMGLALSPESHPRRNGSAVEVNDETIYDDDDLEIDEVIDIKLGEGLQVLHVASASLSAKALTCLLEGIGPQCPVRELNLSSNNFGAAGAQSFVLFMTAQQKMMKRKALPFLDRLDMSNNDLGDEGTAQLTNAITKSTSSKRPQEKSIRQSLINATHNTSADHQLVDLKLSSNSIGSVGIETIMDQLRNKHDLLSLSLDKNAIGDQGCQLVAASLQSMKSLSRLNLSFNQIGSRGINSLMRSLIACDSITYLGLSGNILRISGAIALAFTLAQHPRLEEVDLDNCCLGQAAQCHIVSGIISNRWVPMKRLKGYTVGPPMVAIGALKPFAANLTNEECFRIRKDEQMKTILRWTEENRSSRHSAIDPAILAAAGLSADADYQQSRFLTPDFVATINDVHGTPSQNAYFRLLSWLGQIPFDEAEFNALQKYFYDSDGEEGDRGSEGFINLKLRGDLLAALDSEVADEFREEFPSLASAYEGSIGIDLDKLYSQWSSWQAFQGKVADEPPPMMRDEDTSDQEMEDTVGELENDLPKMTSAESSSSIGKLKVQPRITMFPQFEQQLQELKAAATDMIDQEEEPMQHEIILTQFAEASLTILRQLRYLCMNSGLDGWRKGGLKRKILIVDDSIVIRKMVSRAFESADFIVDSAADGKEGVEKLKASIYDIAFMDIDMPVMNGFDATKELRQWEDAMRPGCRQPICALTATNVDDFERHELMRFKEAGLDVFESKPCKIPRLFKVVDDVSPMFSDLSLRQKGEQSSFRLSTLSDSFSEKSSMSGYG